MENRLFIPAALFALLASALPAFAQAPARPAATVAAADADAYRQVVRDVVVRASGGSAASDPAEYVRSHVSATTGQFITQATLSKDQRELLDTGTFSDVRIFVEPLEDGVRVIYEVAVAPRFLPPLDLHGNTAIRDRKILGLMGLTHGDRIDRARVDKMVDKVREEYRKRYYPAAKIDATISPPNADGFSTITLRIDEGERDRVRGFEFTGNEAFGDGRLSRKLGRMTRWNPVFFFWYSWRHNVLDFEYVRDTLTTLYRDSGYLDVAIDPPELVRKTPGDPPVMKIAIHEGPLYTVSKTAFEGVSLFPETELRRIAGLYLPEGAPAGATALRDAAKAVGDYYRSRGYVDTAVRTSYAVPSAGADAAAGSSPLAVTFHVEEGFLAYVRSINISGNSVTKEKVIRREITVAPGLLLDEVAADLSRRRIENLGYFESVRFHETPDKDDPSQRDLFYEVTEKDTMGNLMVGVGASSVDSIVGFFEVSQNNFDIANWPTFRGAGEKARLSIMVGDDTNSGELSWSRPWFMDRRMTLDADLYRRESGHSEYDETRIGGGLALTVPVVYGRITARAGVEFVEIDDVLKGSYTLAEDPSVTDFRFSDMDDGYLRVPLRLTWTYDTRNRPFAPSSGMRNQIFGELQPAALGSDYDLCRAGIDLRQYVPLFFGHYLSFHLRAESIDAFGDDEVPISERYFIGGGRTIRGFRYRDVGPKAIPSAETGGRARPVGGQTLGLFSAEYNVPILGFLRTAAFYDIGNVWADAFDADFNEYASSWGIGLRLDFPGFPIRLDYAFPLDEDDEYSRKEHFVFWIGFE